VNSESLRDDERPTGTVEGESTPLQDAPVSE
jgi:hypothetical protein